MSLVFKAHCNNCITPLQRGYGHVCSCSCFLCEECAKQLDGGGNCPSCDKPGVKVLDLSSNLVPSEVTTSLSDATARLESFHSILQFQIRHYKKALDGAHVTISELKAEVQSLKEGYDVPLNRESMGKRKFFEMDEDLSTGDGSFSRPRSSPAAEMSSPPHITNQAIAQGSAESTAWRPFQPSMYGPSRELVAQSPSPVTSVSTDQRSRPQSSPDRNSRGASSPTARLIREAHQRLSPSVTPSSLYSQQGRARSPSVVGHRNGVVPSIPHGRTPTVPADAKRTSEHFRTQEGTPASSSRVMTRQRGTAVTRSIPKTRSPFLAIRSPSVRPGTGGSLGSAGARTPLLGTVGAEATKEELLELRRQESERRDMAKQRQEVTRFQDLLQ